MNTCTAAGTHPKTMHSGLVYTPTHHRTHDFPSCTTPTHHRTHAKSAKNTVPIAAPTITPTLHPHYTHLTPTLHPRAISVCRKNVCKNVCVSNMYVDLYAIQLTVLLLDYCTPAEHPHLHPHPRILPNTHTYTHAISENRVFVIPIPADFRTYGFYPYLHPNPKISGAPPLTTESESNEAQAPVV